jgi:hypothetical protein
MNMNSKNTLRGQGVFYAIGFEYQKPIYKPPSSICIIYVLISNMKQISFATRVPQSIAKNAILGLKYVMVREITKYVI